MKRKQKPMVVHYYGTRFDTSKEEDDEEWVEEDEGPFLKCNLCLLRRRTTLRNKRALGKENPTEDTQISFLGISSYLSSSISWGPLSLMVVENTPQ